MKYIMIAFLVLFSTVSNAQVKNYGAEIPWKADPNQKTLEHYLDKYLYWNVGNNARIEIKANVFYTKWLDDKDATTDKVDTKEMSKKNIGLLSYMKYDNGKITINQKNDKFNLPEHVRWHSQSVGKSIISYVTGHAICKGYIDNGINHIVTMPMIENTLYNNQKLIDLLNMNAGDQKYVNMSGFVNSKKYFGEYKGINWPTIENTMDKVFENTSMSKQKYNYNNLVPNLVFTYVAYKTGEDFDDLLQSFFVNKVGIEHDVYFVKQEEASKRDLSYWYYFFGSKNDYMRIAIAMLDDWNNNTCEGQYLKSLYDNKLNKKNNQQYNNNKTCICALSTHYAGQFHTNLPGARNRAMFLMDGYGGNSTVIDFENNKILSVLSIHRNYNWKKIIQKEYKSW
jgi:hypothetical protein